jgi:hypothetical protein
MKKVITILAIAAFLFSVDANAGTPKGKKKAAKTEKACSASEKKACASSEKKACCAAKKTEAKN